ncbi:MAG: replication-relaxation family protein [Patescibacteria group bacterium]|jgi:hypothetical protein
MPIEVLASYYQDLFAGLQSGFVQYQFVLQYLGWALLVVILTLFVQRILAYCVALWEPSTFLLVTPPRETNTSFTTTNELFTLLAGLMRYRPLLERLLVPASRYSFEIVSTKSAGIQYVLRVPRRQVDVVTKTLRGYLPGMQVRAINEYLPGHSALAKIIPFRLKTHFALPLKEQVELSAHDPIAYLTNSMTQLDEHERIALQIVVRPLSRMHDWVLMRSIHGLLTQVARGERASLGSSAASSVVLAPLRGIGVIVEQVTGVVAMIANDAAGNFRTPHAATVPLVVPISASDLEQNAEIKRKLEQPLFLASIRAYVQVDRPNLRSREQGIGGSFESFTGSNGQGLRPSFDLLKLWRFRTRQLGGGVAVLSSSELAGLFHFPQTKTSETEDLVRVRSRELPAPLSFKHAAPNFDTVFATNSFGGVTTPIGLTLEERRRHTYILGATGSGKTTLLATMIHQDIVNGKGVAVVDPHGQLVEQLLRTIPKERIKDVVWFAPDDDGYPIALNLLDLPVGETATPSQRAKQKSLVASHLISVFQKFYDAKYFGPRMEYVLRNAILTALETPEPTLLTILNLLTKKDYRKGATSHLPTGVLKDFWTYEFEKLGSLQRNQMISPITNKLGAILSSPLNYQILSQPKSKLDFSAVMDEGKILLCDLSKGKIGEDESNFFGSLVIAKLQLAALGRARMPEAERRDFFLYVDEFQNFATGAFTELVSEARKYRLATILAHQSISQISERDIIKVILANVGTTITFRTANPEDESFLLPIFAPEVGRYDIPNLPLYRAYMKVAVGEPRAAFMADVSKFDVPDSDEMAQQVIATSRLRYSSPAVVPSVPAVKTAGAIRFGELKASAPIPYQSRSSVGVGRKGKVRNTHSTMPTEPLTPKQLEILTLLTHFRFLDRSQIQRLLNHQHHSTAIDWLNDLTDKQYLTRIEPKTSHEAAKPVYYLAPKALKTLKTEEQDPKSFNRLEREAERSPDFIRRCLLLADIFLDLRDRSTKRTHHTLILPDEFNAIHSYAIPLAKLLPHAIYICERDKHLEQSFVEILTASSRPRLMHQIRRYLKFFDTGAWQAVGDDTFPTVLLIAPNETTYVTARSLVKKLLSELELEVSHPTVRIASADAVRTHGATGEIWETLCLTEEA